MTWVLNLWGLLVILGALRFEFYISDEGNLDAL